MRGGAGTALVGDPETVAARMKEYMALGIDTFILSGYPHLEEAYRFAELVFPLLPLAHAHGAGAVARQHRAVRRDHRQRSSPAAPAGRRSHERRRRCQRGSSTALSQWALPLGILAGLAGRCRPPACIPTRVLPAPTDVVAAGWTLLLSGELVHNIWVSFWRAMVGFAHRRRHRLRASGSPTACRSARSGCSTRTLQMVRNIPHLALIPLVILWFGIDEDAKIFLVALGVFFPIYINTLHGIRTVDPQLVEMGRTYGMSPATLFWRVILPGALPSIFVGLRYALGIMWLTLIVAETIAASSGIGYMAMQAREFLLVDVVVLSILIYALLGKLADSAARLLERLCLSWHPAFQKR